MLTLEIQNQMAKAVGGVRMYVLLNKTQLEILFNALDMNTVLLAAMHTNICHILTQWLGFNGTGLASLSSGSFFHESK